MFKNNGIIIALKKKTLLTLFFHIRAPFGNNQLTKTDRHKFTNLSQRTIVDYYLEAIKGKSLKNFAYKIKYLNYV